MAEDNRNSGHRASEPYARTRAAASSQPPGDPLAELARLIGQQNEAAVAPKKNTGWTPPRPRNPAPDPFADRTPQQAHTQGYGAQAHQGYADPQQYYPDQQQYAEQQQQYADYQHSQHSHYADGYGQPGYDPRGFEPHFADHAYQQGAAYPGNHGYAEQGRYDYGTEQGGHAHYGAAYAAPGYGYAEQQYGAMPAAGQGGDPAYGDAYYAQQVPQPVAEDHAARKRRGMVTALAVLALAVVGTASAFGYRAMFGSSGTPVPPPVIKADSKPTKIVPATDANAKPIQDRIGVKTERVVSREEQPVEIRDPGKGGASRVVFPNLADKNQPASPTIASLAAAATASAPTVGPEPKKIRTVAIKPDLPAETASTRASTPARNTEADSRGSPAQSGSAPLPLSPNAQSQTQPQPRPQRQASRGNEGAAPFPAPIGSSNAGAGAYAVQVTSQRTESDAQAAYKSLQGQFPSVLGSRQAVIRRADLGDKGTYYRAQIPFSSQSEASEFCSNLKAAGGQCVVQRN